ncbi:MAG: signal recognition particle receptor subunit alpha, partial [Culicoidibacterales bacterium]
MGLFNKFKKMFQSEKVEPEVQVQPEVQAQAEIEVEPQGHVEPVIEEIVYDWSDSATSEVLVEQPVVEQEQIANDYHDKMGKTRSGLLAGFNDLMARFRTVDEEYFEELEDILIMADVGVKTVMELTDQLRHEVKVRNVKQPSELNEVIVEKMYEIYQRDGIAQTELNIQSTGPTVILFVGVNGVGKTTTIAKLAHRFKAEGKSVIMAAGDTFRAGAVDQLQVWGDRLGVEVVKTKPNGDPSAVMFDAIDRAKTENIDIVLCDTAGRLQNKVNLMN